MDVKPMPGLEHLPYAEVWFRTIDEASWREASECARELGKTGLEAWTTDETPDVVAFLQARGYEEVRRYVISELDVASAPEPAAPAFDVASLAERPLDAATLHAIAREAYPDQPGRADSIIGGLEAWRRWGLDPHAPDAYFVAWVGGEPVGFGYLTEENGTWTHGFAAVVRAHRGRGIAGSIKRAEIAWAKAHGVPALRTATEARLLQMRALNERLGYRPLYEEIVLRGPVTS